MAAKRRRLIAVTAAITCALVAAGAFAAWQFGLLFTNPSVHGEPVALPESSIETLTTGLEVPWGIAFLPDGTALVTERNSGRVLAVKASARGTATGAAPKTGVTEFARIGGVAASGEGGLLGIAVSPRYAQDGWIYVYYTAAADNRVVRLRAGGSAEPILTGIRKAGVHNGGRIAFGPDGMLYIGTGDAGDRDAAQDRTTLGGKILRITPDGAPAPGNPFPNSPVYSYGHRNVQGLAWDAAGQLYATEFGQNRYDELNRISAGANYGWPVVEGASDNPDYVPPVATWTTSDASPSGLAILGDKAYVACLRGAKLYRIGLDGQGGQQLLSGQYGRLRAVTVAPDATLWVSTSNRDGRGSPADGDDRILRLLPDRF